MNSKVEKIKGFRTYLLGRLSELSPQQWNKIPAGYSNNIVWNFAHLIAVQQLICYVRSGLPVVAEEKWCTAYLSGTQPGTFVDEEEINRMKEAFLGTIDQLQKDIDKGIFVTYEPSAMIPKVYGFGVNHIDDVLEYLLYHEGYHTGCITALLRFV